MLLRLSFLVCLFHILKLSSQPICFLPDALLFRRHYSLLLLDVFSNVGPVLKCLLQLKKGVWKLGLEVVLAKTL